MPGIQNNAQPTQAQNATTSNEGTSKVPKLDAKSFFYLEDGTFTQAPSQKFGIVSTNEFRTTSTVSITSKKIVSICSGQIFIQPLQGDTTKVNLILKPYKQPVAGLAIKYFIYRGLPKSQFLDSANKVLATGSGLITHIRTEFLNFYQQHPSLAAEQPELFGKYIGFPDSAAPVGQSQQATDLIDDYFYKISQTFADETGDITNQKRAFEMPMIPAGLELTTAISGEIGLDIVLNYGDYFIENDSNPFKLDLNFARAPFGTINVSTITDAYQKKVMREAATIFVDPAAFYGLHTNGGKVLKLGVATPLETSATIYPLITNFVTKNTIYLYVQSNRQRSYNFYNKYVVSDTNANNIKIGDTEANLQETTFETDSWPLKVYSATPVVNSDKLSIALQFTTDRGVNTSLFGLLANLNSNNSEGFVGSTDLNQEPDTNGAISNYTKTILLTTPATANVTIASIIQLIYLGKSIILSKPGIDDDDPSTPSPDPIYFTPKYMDDVFDLVNSTSFLKADKIYHVHSYKPTFYSQQEIDKNRGKVIAFTQRTENTITISETENINLFTYLAIVENEESKHSNFSPTPSSNKTATGFGIQNLSTFQTLPNLPENEYVELKTFSDSGKTITGIFIKAQDNSFATTLLIGITETENNILKAFNSNIRNTKLYLESFFEENNEFISSEGIKYKKFKLGVLVDKLDFTQEAKLPDIDDTIIVYTLDDMVFFSKRYSENIPEYYNKTSIEIKIIE